MRLREAPDRFQRQFDRKGKAGVDKVKWRSFEAGNAPLDKAAMDSEHSKVHVRPANETSTAQSTNGDAADSRTIGGGRTIGGTNAACKTSAGTSSMESAMVRWFDKRDPDSARELLASAQLPQVKFASPKTATCRPKSRFACVQQCSPFALRVPAAQMLLDVMNANRVLSPAVVRRLVSFVSSQGLREAKEPLQRERADALYRKLLDSPLFSTGEADVNAGIGRPFIISYIKALPQLTRERNGRAPPTIACFTEMILLLETLHARFGSEMDVSMSLARLVQPLRGASRSVNLSMDLEDRACDLLATLSRVAVDQRKDCVDADKHNDHHPEHPPDMEAFTSSVGAVNSGTSWLNKQNDHQSIPLHSTPKPRKVDVPKDAARPIDWRTLPVFPTHKDLHGEPLQLPRAVAQGTYGDGEQYLMTHFCLTREDMMSPLREGIAAYLQGTFHDGEIHLYSDVELVGLVCASQGVRYRVSFRPRTDVDWARSNRLVPGSLLALSNDDFRSIIWATVATRDLSLLQGDTPNIDISFPDHLHHDFQIAKSRGARYVMAESQIDFDAYRHLLQTLQKMDADMLPFAPTLLECKPAVESQSSSVCLPELTAVDESQNAALQAALSKQVAIIQGPPGTGKTHVARCLLRLFLAHKSTSGANPNPHHNTRPVLFICPTSKALDRMLEDLISDGVVQPEQIAEGLVRIGPPTDSSALEHVSLFARTAKALQSGAEQRQAWRMLSKQQEELRLEIEAVSQRLRQREPTAEDLEEFCTTAQIMSMCAAPDGWLDIEEALQKWLQPVRDAVHLRTSKAIHAANSSGRRQHSFVRKGCDVSQEIVQEKRQPQRIARAAGNREADWAAVTRVEDEDAGETEEELWEEELLVSPAGDLQLQVQVERAIEAGNPEDSSLLQLKGVEDVAWPDDETRDFLLEHDELWQLEALHREQLTAIWLDKKYEAVYEDLSRLCDRYERVCSEKGRLAQKVEFSILDSASLIGATTTAVAKYSALINSLRVQVVMVEESAEVLESHVLVTLSSQTRHLILIGDRRQVRTRAVAKLAKYYRIDASTFERLINRGVENTILTCQHRSRPEIAGLLASLGGNMSYDPSAVQVEGVRGVEKPVYFLKHSKKDSFSSDCGSRVNSHEAKFLAALVCYLVKLGYASNQLVVLVPYCGQLLLLKQELKDVGQSDVQVFLIKQFQGDGADIVLVSLVRSHEGTGIGLVGVESYINSIFSRSRLGLYLVGNADLLGASSKIWAAVIRRLEQNDTIGKFLPLLTTRADNPHRHALVSRAEDFDGLLLKLTFTSARA